jgi:hypothetical protein
MDVLPGRFFRAVLILTALLTAAPSGAVSVRGAAAPAARAAVVDYYKQRRDTRQELGADDMRRVQGLGQVLLSAQAGVRNDVADASLRQEIRSLHDELDQAIAAANTPHFSGRQETSEAVAETMDMPLRVNARLRIENGKWVMVDEPSGRRGEVGASRRTARMDNEEPVRKSGDHYGRIRARLDALRSRIEMTSATNPKAAGGKAADRRMYSSHMAKKARQLSDEVRVVIDALPSVENQRELADLRDRLREKTLDAALGVSSTPVTPTFTTLIQHR